MTRSSLLLFLAKRLAGMAALLILLSFIVFSLTYVTPGSAVDLLLGPTRRTPQAVAAIEEKYHLNDPFLQQYWYWLKHAVHGDLGTSISTSLPVSDQLRSRLPTSAFLGLYAFVLAVLFGVIPGMVAGLRRGGAIDRTIVAGSIVALSMPSFVAGIFALYLFSVLVPVFPVAGRGTWFLDELWHLTLPAIALALSVVAYLLRHTRAAMLGVAEQDYMTFARARGLSSRRIMLRYALRNALIPIVTISGPVLAGMFVGAVIVETTFSISGVGNLLIQSVQSKDVPMTQGVALLFGVILVGMNLVADLTYFAIDPRIRLRGRS